MLNIRKASKEDCEVIASIKKQVWKTTYLGIYPDKKINKFDIEYNEKKFKKMIDDHQQILYVVLDDLKIIGYFSFGKILRPFENYQYDIGLLYLLKEYQGKGVGTKIFLFCKEALKEKDVNEFIISCNKYNLPAQEFYKKMGGLIIYTDNDHEDKSLPQTKFLFRI